MQVNEIVVHTSHLDTAGPSTILDVCDMNPVKAYNTHHNSLKQEPFLLNFQGHPTRIYTSAKPLKHSIGKRILVFQR